MGFEEHLAQDARLVILKELATQRDGRLNETLIEKVLDVFGYRRSRDWIRTQLRAMADLGAITLTEAGSVMVAAIARAGRDHLERRGDIEGIATPSDEV